MKHTIENYVYRYTNIQSGDVTYSLSDDRFEDEIVTGHVSRECFILEDAEEIYNIGEQHGK